tara:strand:+ start:364 stop:471 length:108 start_codon:yes stop_codon:yes gene_type:complete
MVEVLVRLKLELQILAEVEVDNHQLLLIVEQVVRV